MASSTKCFAESLFSFRCSSMSVRWAARYLRRKGGCAIPRDRDDMIRLDNLYFDIGILYRFRFPGLRRNRKMDTSRILRLRPELAILMKMMPLVLLLPMRACPLEPTFSCPQTCLARMR